MFETTTTQAARRLSMAEAEVRRARYLPFVLPWTEIDPAPRALDLDCGAGGWLRLLAAAGFHVEGREDDPDMRATARTTGFSVTPHGDDHLSGIADGTLSVLTAFEMLTRHSLEEIAARLPDMLRVLRRGGILIIGGENAEYPRAQHARSRAEEVATHLHSKAPGRLSIVRTEGAPHDHSVGPEIAVVIQRDAKGVAFDRFHAAFADVPGPSPQGSSPELDHLTQYIDHLVRREVDSRLALEERVLRLEQRVAEQEVREGAQRAEIEGLRHVTRRRGLRRWLHERKMARKTNDISTARDIEVSAPPLLSPPPAPSMRPLSQRMRALRDQLTR